MRNESLSPVLEDGIAVRVPYIVISIRDLGRRPARIPRTGKSIWGPSSGRPSEHCTAGAHCPAAGSTICRDAPRILTMDGCSNCWKRRGGRGGVPNNPPGRNAPAPRRQRPASALAENEGLDTSSVRVAMMWSGLVQSHYRHLLPEESHIPSSDQNTPIAKNIGECAVPYFRGRPQPRYDGGWILRTANGFVW